MELGRKRVRIPLNTKILGKPQSEICIDKLKKDDIRIYLYEED